MNNMQAIKTKSSKGLGYHFLPRRFQRANILTWLKRVHAWTGVWGALLFLLVGISGFLLNHHSLLEIDTGPPEITQLILEVDPERMTSPDTFAGWVKDELQIKTEPSQPSKKKAKPATFAGSEREQLAEWRVRFSGPNASLEASYIVGANIASITSRQNNVLALLKNLHKGSGLGIAWILFFDALTGALIFMSITGILLWSKLHGSRLVGIGLLFGGVMAAVLAAIPSILMPAI